MKTSRRLATKWRAADASWRGSLPVYASRVGLPCCLQLWRAPGRADVKPQSKEAEQTVFPDLGIEIADLGGASATGRICFFLPEPDLPLPDLPDYALSYLEIVRHLLDDGHEVTVVCASGRFNGAAEGDWAKHIRGALDGRACWLTLPGPGVSNRPGPFGHSVVMPYAVLEWLKRQSFDIVHAPDSGGVLFYCLAAKELGVRFGRTHFCVTTTTPGAWVDMANAQPVGGLSWLARSFMERRSIELADTVVSPSQYLLGWMLDHGYRLPDRSCVHPWVPHRGPVSAPRTTAKVAELVYIGELEPRKGLPQFVDAVARMVRDGVRPSRVVFAGPANPNFPYREFIKKKIGKLGVNWRLRPDLHTISAVEYVANGPRLGVVPSLADTVSWSVQELLRRGLPVIVSDASGLVEQIHPEDREVAVFPLHPGRLANRLEKAFRHGAPVPRPAANLDSVGRIWRTWHARQIASERSIPRIDPTDAQPLITVCLMHFNRPNLLQQAIASIKKQSYPNVEVVLVDDGSTDPAVPGALTAIEADFSPRGWRVVRQENLFLGAARNAAARHARGKYLFFLDDDNVLKPDALETAVKAAEYAGLDILTSFSDSFDGAAPPDGQADPSPTRIVHLGDDVTFGLFRNGFGDSNALIRREAFDALGGNTEDYGVGKDDQEFFARAVLSGYKLRHLPEPLFWARQSTTRLRHLHYSPYSGSLRVADAYRPFVPSALQDLLIVAQGQQQELEAWDPAGVGKVGGVATRNLVKCRAALFGTVSTMSRQSGHSNALEKAARRGFELQTLAFSRLIAFETWLAQKAFRTYREIMRRLGV